MTSFDIIVLGSGPGGYVAAIRASQLGFHVAIVEKDELGGVCLNWGCIPTKALLKSAEVLQYARSAEDYGIQIKKAEADFEKIISRSRDITKKMNNGIQFLMKKYKITVITGYGKIKPGKRIEVTDNEGKIEEYQAQHIIIATGAKARSLPNLPIDGEKIISYKEALNLEKAPKDIIIVGAGAIGCEFTYFFQSLGIKVTLIELAKNIVPQEDEDVSKQLKKSFEKMGVTIHTMSRVVTSKIQSGSVELFVSTPSGEVKMQAGLVLSAIGISANIDNIGLEYSGIKTERGKTITDEFYRTNVEGYYAIGDITTGIALAHVASEEAVVCIEKIAGLSPTPIIQNNIPKCTYTSPEIASVGMTEKEAKEAGYEILVGKYPFSASGKAQALGHTEGFVKVIFDKKYDELLGAHLIGVNVTEMIGEIALAKNAELTAHEIINTIHPHPSISEAVKEAVAMAYGVAVNM
ncbi:MAG: dihydrolipoyl dehydrogenase [Chitinophagales bacterium]|nr:dihydrolipoyl dehydrogenase [Chitinophagales bacterium]